MEVVMMTRIRTTMKTMVRRIRSRNPARTRRRQKSRGSCTAVFQPRTSWVAPLPRNSRSVTQHLMCASVSKKKAACPDRCTRGAADKEAMACGACGPSWRVWKGSKRKPCTLPGYAVSKRNDMGGIVETTAGDVYPIAFLLPRRTRRRPCA